MTRRDVRVRGEPRRELDIERFARALLALAVVLQPESNAAAASETGPAEPSETPPMEATS